MSVDRLWAPIPIDERLKEALIAEVDPDRACLLVDALAEIRSLRARLSDAHWTLYPDRSGG